LYLLEERPSFYCKNTLSYFLPSFVARLARQ
jgi:hypothetical protein